MKQVVHCIVWRSGHHTATEFFIEHGIDFDFNEALSHEVVDFLCPNGGGTYPGILKEKDCSIITIPTVPNPNVPAPLPASPDSDDEDDGNNGEDTEQLDDLLNISLADILPEPEEDQEDENAASSLVSSTAVERSQSNDWLEYALDTSTTKHIHKSLVLRDYRQLAVGRLLRVRCYTKDGRCKPNLNHQEFSGEHSFNVGGIAVALIRTGDLVAASACSPQLPKY
ncbi:hypothetical protein MVEN_01294100 [Mycena venus]|uniref:Uncharacterized protein n=1 Tax=Mycena venus TaxID=2733690 RepID=A0A8H7CWJ1_9AGAR|nr:hypothetical protein MVEN_01294100 [Mycena venus]